MEFQGWRGIGTHQVPCSKADCVEAPGLVLRSISDHVREPGVGSLGVYNEQRRQFNSFKRFYHSVLLS